MKELPFFKIWKQKCKGIYDSPCEEECNFRNSQRQCSHCGLYRSEKKEWKSLSKESQIQIRNHCKQRLAHTIFV